MSLTCSLMQAIHVLGDYVKLPRHTCFGEDEESHHKTKPQAKQRAEEEEAARTFALSLSLIDEPL